MIIRSTSILSFLLFLVVSAKKFKEEEKPAWAKKDIRDYSDADVERLLDQWEVCKFLFNLFKLKKCNKNFGFTFFF